MQNNNIDITPDMLKNFANILKNSSSSGLKDAIPDNLFNMSSNKNSSKSTNSTENVNGIDIDFETILKIKSVMEKLNKKDDPRTNLLYSLKPYLNKKRQQKLDQYANILKLSDVATLFKDQKKGDEN